MNEVTTYEWERQDNETEDQYRAFLIYRDLGNQRSLVKAWKLYAPDATDNPSASFGGWSSRHKWRDRAREWDRHMQRIEDATQENEFKKVRRAEKENRLEMLNALRLTATHLANVTIGDKASLTKSSDIKNTAAVIALYLEQSRIEMGESTKGGSEITVNTKVDLSDAVASARERLQSLVAEKPRATQATRDNKLVQ